MASEIALCNITVEYLRKDRLGRVRSAVRALDRVSLNIPAGSVMGVAGSSGSGKSTLARCIAGWQRPSSGQIAGNAAVQLVMQDPGASLNPRFSAFEIVEEPLRIRGREKASPGRVRALLNRVAVGGEGRRASEFSGGERARLAIARALAAMPESGPGLLIFDESLSSLDVETRLRILQMLLEFREEHALSYLFISHDLDMLAGVITDLVILHEGRIVEHGAPDEVMAAPRHESTVLLVNCMSTAK
jgi:ABC-type glutathione transport system ATPase component